LFNLGGVTAKFNYYCQAAVFKGGVDQREGKKGKEAKNIPISLLDEREKGRKKREGWLLGPYIARMKTGTKQEGGGGERKEGQKLTAGCSLC